MKEPKVKTESNQPQTTPVPNVCGYPNNIPNTQTQKTRGTGAATKGTGFSKNSD
tara:strand:+ start:1090 stop:1251 length:162 start_codon:yes stop_codon:yes gene_type:complete